MSAVEHEPPEDNAELARMYEEDQADREPVARTNTVPEGFWERVGARDTARRSRAREMLAAGQVRTANDFDACAMLFQHGTEPDDYLFAHILASIAGFKGHSHGKWLSAAALDRFLQHVGRTQVFGTQYDFGPNATLVLKDVSNLLSDQEREQFRVRPTDMAKRPASGGSWLG
jgi:hypothetical protein